MTAQADWAHARGKRPAASSDLCGLNRPSPPASLDRVSLYLLHPLVYLSIVMALFSRKKKADSGGNGPDEGGVGQGKEGSKRPASQFICLLHCIWSLEHTQLVYTRVAQVTAR